MLKMKNIAYYFIFRNNLYGKCEFGYEIIQTRLNQICKSDNQHFRRIK